MNNCQTGEQYVLIGVILSLSKDWYEVPGIKNYKLIIDNFQFLTFNE